MRLAGCLAAWKMLRNSRGDWSKWPQKVRENASAPEKPLEAAPVARTVAEAAGERVPAVMGAMAERLCAIPNVVGLK